VAKNGTNRSRWSALSIPLPFLLLAAGLFSTERAALTQFQPTLSVVSTNKLETTASPGFSYQLQHARSLGPAAVWSDVGAPVTVSSPGTPLSWTFAPTNSESYFRIALRDPSSGPLTAAEAEARVVSEMIRPAERTNLVLGLRWPTNLTAGAVLEPLSNSDENPKRWTNTAPSYLLVIDHAPSQKLGHPFTWVLIEIASGAMRTINSFSPPVVDGSSRLTTLADRWKAEARFFPTNFSNLPPLVSLGLDIPDVDLTNFSSIASAPFTSLADAGGQSTVNCSNVVRRKVAVVIASGADHEIQNDAREMSALLTRLGFQVTDYNSSSNTIAEIGNGIRQAGQGLGPCDKFFVYISSHTVLSDENNDGKPDGTPSRLDFGMGHSTATSWLWIPNRAGTFTAPIQSVTAGQVNIMLDTCFAEAFAVTMRNMRGLLTNGVNWSVFASSSRTNTSGGASELDLWLDYGNDDVNSIYTGKILDKVTAAADANQIDTNGDGQLSIEEIEQAFTNAHTAAANELATGQKPKFDQFQGAVPMAVPDTFTVPPARSGVYKVALNDTLPPGAQFVLVTPPSLHADLFSWNPQTGEMTLTGLSTLSQVTFTYKFVAGPLETTPVTVTIRFDARMNYAEEFLISPDDPNKVRVPCLILDGLHYPIYQFRLANNPADTCKEPHWHSNGQVFQLDVLNGPGRNDPNPPACGFGRVKEVQAGTFDISKDVWQQFLIDHIPPF
jgi:hypothetical protein